MNLREIVLLGMIGLTAVNCVDEFSCSGVGKALEEEFFESRIRYLDIHSFAEAEERLRCFEQERRYMTDGELWVDITLQSEREEVIPNNAAINFFLASTSSSRIYDIHNHPNGGPPSYQDILAHRYYSKELKPKGRELTSLVIDLVGVWEYTVAGIDQMSIGEIINASFDEIAKNSFDCRMWQLYHLEKRPAKEIIKAYEEYGINLKYWPKMTKLF